MAIKSLSKGKYKSPRGQIVARLLEGTLAGNEYVIGDTDFTRNITTEKSERFTNEFAIKTKAYSEVDQIDAKLNITAYQSGLIAQMVANMSEAAAKPEAALADQSLVLEDVDFARMDDLVVTLPARRVDLATLVVSDGAGVEYEEGVHYNVETGKGSKTIISIFTKPDLAAGDLQVDYDRLASAGDRYNFGSLTEVLVELIFVENVKPGSSRVPETHLYHRVGLTVDGDYQLVGSDSAPRTVTIVGTIYPDSSKPEPLGYIETNIV